jgi:hypothetical protein
MSELPQISNKTFGKLISSIPCKQTHIPNYLKYFLNKSLTNESSQTSQSVYILKHLV